MTEQQEISDEKYFFLPTQVIEFEDYIILRRGVTHLKVSGDTAFEIIKVIMILGSEDGATIQEIVNYFDGSYRESIEHIAEQLTGKRFLVTESEKKIALETEGRGKELSNFYWVLNFGEQQLEKISATRLHVIGINHISLRICELLKKSGFGNIELIDYPLLRNQFYFNDNGPDASKLPGDAQCLIVSYSKWLENMEDAEFDMLITTSDFGGTYYMRDFNKLCVENSVPFFAVALQNMKAYVGPMVIPGFTACFECFLQRQNANLEDFETLRSIELSDYEGQSITASHPAMSFMAADVAMMEIFKFYSSATPSQNTGRIIEINMLKTEMKNRLVLKIPRCHVCGNIHKVSATSVFDNAFMPTHSE